MKTGEEGEIIDVAGRGKTAVSMGAGDSAGNSCATPSPGSY